MTTKPHSPAGRGDALAERTRRGPVDQLDADDRLYERATYNDAKLRRQIEWDRHCTWREWQQLAIRMVGLAVGLGLYLLGIIVLVRSIPGLSTRQAATIVGSALALASGGMAVSHLVRRRGRRPADPATPQ